MERQIESSSPAVRVLFVDDDKRLLEGLRRTLRAKQRKWSVAIADGGEQALQLLQAEPFDVIVSDMRMPRMTGAQLLDAVAKTYPAMIRFILSGQSEEEVVLQSINCTHQFLSKPCDTEQLIRAVDRAHSLRTLFRSGELLQVVSRMKNLPSIPDRYAEISRVVEKENYALSEIETIIKNDPPMLAKILQIANSAYFGTQRSVTEIGVALTFLGIDVIRTLVLATEAFSQFDIKKCREFDVEGTWKHCTGTGGWTLKIARELNLSKQTHDAATAAGMLHDIGKLVMIAGMEEEYRSILQAHAERGTPVHAIEREILGLTHAELGAYLLGIWGIPEIIVQSTAFHHEPWKFGSKSADLVDAVFLADLLDRAQPGKGVEQFPIPELPSYLETRGLTAVFTGWLSSLG